MSPLPPWLTLGPVSVERPAAAATTAVGVLDAAAVATVDAAGLVQLPDATWSLDWWVGAEDRWHLPGRERALRQRRSGAGPVVETALRIPGGDAVHRVWAARAGGGEVVVVEVENASPTPVAVALALRPYGVGGSGSLPAVDVADTTVAVGGRPALWLPRAPSEAAAAGGRDLADDVVAGRSLRWSGPVADPTGRATAVLVYPLPHTARLRVVLPLGPSGPPQPVAPASVPGPDVVARGWEAVLDAAARVTVPDPALTELAARCRARVLLAAAELPASLARLDPGAGVVTAALAAGGHDTEALRAVAALADASPGRPASPAAVVEAVGATASAVAWCDDRRAAAAVTDVLVDLVSHVDRRRTRSQAGPALAALAAHVRGLGQDGAAADLARRAGPAGEDPWAWAGPAPTARHLAAELAATGPTGSFPGDDPQRAAAAWLAVRRSLVVEGADGVRLLAGFTSSWRGGVAEVHRLPTSHGRLSFALRWHGYRPALLWELQARPGDRPAVLRCPALDPAWSSVEPSGEALLAGTAEGLGPAPGEGDSFS